MVTFLKTVAALACMVLIIPLAVWAGSGNARHAWYALKQYLLVMGILVGIAGTFSAISLLVSYLS